MDVEFHHDFFIATHVYFKLQKHYTFCKQFEFITVTLNHKNAFYKVFTCIYSSYSYTHTVIKPSYKKSQHLLRRS